MSHKRLRSFIVRVSVLGYFSLTGTIVSNKIKCCTAIYT